MNTKSKILQNEKLSEIMYTHICITHTLKDVLANKNFTEIPLDRTM